ncbi:MAG: hypothetical protein METHAR1v1_1590017 [Methanothrix sp.]|jgi:hypothetical protein|nr:MAG: hypothetical protein METHAR1v1_1590017 [Methanothrix sp.]
MAHVLVSPLNWGLGHASRDVPIIRELLGRGHQVTVASSGNALELLRREFPECHFVTFEDYPIPYSSTRFFLPKFTAYLPLMMKALLDERRNFSRILSKGSYQMIISDNRMGVYSRDIPSFFMTHQLRFSVPAYIWPVEILSLYVNGLIHSKFDGVIVPDNEPGAATLSGKLSRSFLAMTNGRAYYSGILCSPEKMDVREDLDYLVIISGPEPQRTKLEEILLPQVGDLPGRKVVLLGSPLDRSVKRPDDGTVVHSYVPDREKVELLNRARFVISRSGYTTMMEVAELEKRHGLFVPTPGQTEQEYLSRYYRNQGWFLSRSQYRLNLAEDVEEAMEFSGFPRMRKTGENVRRLYEELFAEHLE